MSGGRGYAHWGLSGAACFPNGGAEARFRTRPEAYSDTRWYDTGQITKGETYQLGGVEGLININRLSVVGEYMSVQMQRSGGASDDRELGVAQRGEWQRVKLAVGHDQQPRLVRERSSEWLDEKLVTAVEQLVERAR